ncbi:MAG: hypothetical protein NT069_17900, partial [Planctomycetota bacterium]|nr:hypothetical protein [Planctomycetota bacterium]
MTTSEALDQIRSRILSRYSLLFLKTWEEERWEAELAEVLLEVERGLVVWTITFGPQPPPTADSDPPFDPLTFLDQIETYPPDHVFLLKDFQPYLKDPRVVRRLRDLAPRIADQNKTILFLGAVSEIPIDLRKEAFEIDLPLPGIEEVRTELAEALDLRNQGSDRPLVISADIAEKLVKAVLGLTAREARKALQLAIQGRD